jgi:subtilisin family serine protease
MMLTRILRTVPLIVLLVLSLALALGSHLAGSAMAQFTLPVTQPESIVRISDGATIPLSELPNNGYAPALANSLSTIGVPAMRNKYPFITGSGQTVAVIDTGIDYNHPALAGRYVTGYDFTDNNDPLNPMDYNMHGTHVSGIIASTDATYGGVAPGVGIIGLKVFSDSGGLATAANITSALNWVATNAATYHITTVNISIGNGAQWTNASVNSGWAYEQALANLKNKGIFVAAASGNDGYLSGVSYPGASPNTVSVGATWASNDWSGYVVSMLDPLDPSVRMGDWGPVKDDIAFFTNRYKTAADGQLDLLAPGAFITSSVPLSLDDDGTPDGWEAMAGTSMASPHVAGAAVLVRQALELKGTLDPDPAHQVDQILSILQDTGVPLLDEFGVNEHNVYQVPAVSSNWYIRPSTGEYFSRIDLNAAIASIDPVPEPGTLVLLVTAGLGLLAYAWRRRRS